MGRPEKPVKDGHAAALATWLRDVRYDSRLSYRELAVKSGCHHTTLQRAATGGNTIPRRRVVLAYAEACGLTDEQARQLREQAEHLWKLARYRRTKATQAATNTRTAPAPRLDLVRTLADLSAAMTELYEKAGSPSLRDMELKGGEHGALPRSTAHRLLHKQTVPYTLDQFRAFLRACDLPQNDYPAWEKAWNIAMRNQAEQDPLAPARRTNAREAWNLGPAGEAVLRVLHPAHGRTSGEVARRAELGPGTASAELKRLRELGLVTTAHRGRNKLHTVTRPGHTVAQMLAEEQTTNELRVTYAQQALEEYLRHLHVAVTNGKISLTHVAATMQRKPQEILADFNGRKFPRKEVLRAVHQACGAHGMPMTVAELAKLSHLGDEARRAWKILHPHDQLQRRATPGKSHYPGRTPPGSRESSREGPTPLDPGATLPETEAYGQALGKAFVRCSMSGRRLEQVSDVPAKEIGECFAGSRIAPIPLVEAIVHAREAYGPPMTQEEINHLDRLRITAIEARREARHSANTRITRLNVRNSRPTDRASST